jgi:hypothetical protein
MVSETGGLEFDPGHALIPLRVIIPAYISPYGETCVA